MRSAQQARERVAAARRELSAAEAELAQIERSCPHSWSEPAYTPDIRGAYHDPGDPPGTMGVDRRLPMDVPRQETPKWTRTCRNCGKTETTTRTTERVTRTPAFGDR